MKDFETSPSVPVAPAIGKQGPQMGEFTPIPMAPGYFASRDGRVFSSIGWRGHAFRELIADLNSDGYPSARVLIAGKRKRISVHRLIASAFLPQRPSAEHEIRHLDGNILNPAADNLEWGTRAQNAGDREAHNRTSRGPKHSEAVRAGFDRKSGLSAPTSGPWNFCRPGRYWRVYPECAVDSGIDYFIANVLTVDGREQEAKANARLIAAAPDMLAALIASEAEYENLEADAPVDSGCPDCTLGTVPDNLNTGRCAHHMRVAAIAKATGKP